MLKDKKYWQMYYENKRASELPSDFAQHVLKRYLHTGMRLLELGCGNGRDSTFFARHGTMVTAVDQCQVELHDTAMSFWQRDFTHLPDNIDTDIIYSRFSLHSIDAAGYDRVIKWLSCIKSDTILCIEVRGKKNEYYGLGEQSSEDPDVFKYENHSRRFIDFQKLISDLENAKYTIKYAKERKGFAPCRGINQTFIRVICKKR